MNIKYEYKIRRMLGNRYHLNTEITFKEDKTKIENWKLFRVYPGWIEDNSDAIMTSKTHTDKELMKFAKEHRKYDLSIVGSKTMSIIAFLNLILIFCNIWFRTKFIIGFTYGIDFTIIVVCLMKIIYFQKNQKVEDKEFKEKMKLLKESIKKKIREEEEKNKKDE